MKKTVFYFFILSVCIACNKRYAIIQTQAVQTRINPDSLQMVDSVMYYTIVPYKQQLDSQMQIVVGSTQGDLLKEKPEGTLCNLMTDAAFSFAGQHYGKPVDLCVLNYGGVRLPSIPKGNITVGQVFELMPFENELVVLEVTGETLLQLLDLVALNEGWPVSGMKMQIADRKAANIFIRTDTLVLNKIYTLVTSDYIANGGDNADMLQNVHSRTSLNYKLRDAIMDYVRINSPLDLKIEGRMTIRSN